MSKRRALIVGIDDYPGTNLDLPSCRADARFAANLLRGTFGFDDLVELHDGDATLEAVSRALGLMLAGARPDDRLVFYYSGHGAHTVRGGELRESLVLHDLLFHDDVLVAATQQLPPGVLTVVLDACFSGGMWKRLGGSRIKSAALVEKALEAPVAYRPFGCAARPNFGPVPAAKKSRCVKASEPLQLNALLVSASLENETAAASSSGTDSLSAFTFALGKAIAALGPRVSIESVLVHVTEVLRDLGIAQSPQLHPPHVPAMNARTPFLAEELGAPAASWPVELADPLLTRVMTASLTAVRLLLQ
ncbi:MAG: caspase family protein [Kofleriaceae bacterium]